jgi:BirA family biotin operon repressor/biotin-[acetyl-CoA-carboxylase] ligase
MSLATDYVAHRLDRVTSTQDEARDRYSGIPCLVVAGAQDAGRGRGGTGWLNAPRALAASLAFDPSWPVEQLPLLTLVAGLSARRVLGSHLWLKWPNDVVTASGDKVAGLLAERTGDLVVVGMGVNLHWPEPPTGMAALEPDDPGPGAGARIAEAWADKFLAATASGPEHWDAAGYRRASATLGTLVTWEGGGPGMAVDVDDSGGLVVEQGGSRSVLRSGRVHSVRPTTLTD